MGRRRCSTVLIVSIECAASPDRMFARLAPSAWSSPRPSDWRRSSSSASRGMVRDDRLAAVLLPPAEGGHVVVVAVKQAGLAGARLRRPVGLPPASRCVPSRSQRDSVGALPSRIARWRTSWASPSISRKSTPGTSLSVRSPRRRAWRRTTLRYQDSSSSIASSADRSAGEHRQAERHDDRLAPARPPSRRGSASIANGHERAVEHERAEAEREHAQRQREAREQRPHERVQHAHQRRGGQRRSGAVQREAAQQLREQQEQRARPRASTKIARSTRAVTASSLTRAAAKPPHPVRVMRGERAASGGDAPSVRAILRVVITVVISAAAIYLIYLVRTPISYIMLGAFVAIAASGPVNLLSRKLPRGAAIAIVYLGIVFAPIVIGLILIPPAVEQGVKLANNLPGVRAGAQPGVRREPAAAGGQREVRHHREAREPGRGPRQARGRRRGRARGHRAPASSPRSSRWSRSS